MASITLAGESLIAQKQAAQQALVIKRFIFANVPGLDPAAAVNRAAPKPVAAQIVYTANIASGNAGYVNPNQVVYSLQVGSDVGDWDFNWIGLESAEGVLFAVAYVPLQQKRRNNPPLQVGNNITRNFLVVFDGAQSLTGITIDAKTWQHDFTVRLAGIDERERQSNRDLFGRACFFGSALQVERAGGLYQLKAGTAYIEGIRIARTSALAFTQPGGYPTGVWVDVSLARDGNDMVANVVPLYGSAANRVDYTDSAGVKHYLVQLADLTNADTIVDRRPSEPVTGALVTHFAARTGDYPGLRARATTKDDVQLSNIPNAISDDEATNSTAILATTKAVKSATTLLWNALANIVAGDTAVGRAVKLATARVITLTGAVTGSVSFDGSGNVSLATTATQATEAVAGGAKVATNAQTADGTDDTTFVSPKKLRWGLSASFLASGYLLLPSWLGGFIFQWGRINGITHTAEITRDITYPIAFTTTLLGLHPTVICNQHWAAQITVYVGNETLQGARLYIDKDSAETSTIGLFWFAIGK
jgi:hypothetical protein